MTGDHPAGEQRRETDVRSRAGALPMDELLSVLARPGNRFVLTYLLLEDGPVSIVELVEYVLETTEPPAGVDRAAYGGLLLARFIETVLPDLHERELVEYDRETQMVTETETTSLTLPYLRAGLQQSSRQAPERDS